MSHPIRHRRHSLYFKLLLIFGATFLLAVAIVTWSFKLFRTEKVRVIHKNVVAYADYMVDDIGVPPDISRAKRLYRERNIEMYIVGPGVEWASSQRLRDTHREKCPFDAQAAEGAHAGHERWRWKKNFIERVSGGYHFLFLPPHFQRAEGGAGPALQLAFIALFTFLVFFLSYRVTRRLFRRLDDLNAAALKLGDGDLSVRVPNGRSDEIGRLATSFNKMADQVEGHVSGMKELLLAISHEVRSPLTRMKVAMESVSDQKMKASLNEDIDAIRQMTETLLEQERLSQGLAELHREKFMVKDLLEEVARPFESSPPGVEIQTSESHEVNADRARLKLALRNILGNAVKYSVGSSKRVELKVDSNQDFVIFSVRDYGEGISDQDLKKVTSSFYRGDSSRSRKSNVEGFGLGLSLARSVAEAHGGALEIESSLGQGTLVRVKIRDQA